MFGFLFVDIKCPEFSVLLRVGGVVYVGASDLTSCRGDVLSLVP